MTCLSGDEFKHGFLAYIALVAGLGSWFITNTYHQVSNIIRTLVNNEIVDHSFSI